MQPARRQEKTQGRSKPREADPAELQRAYDEARLRGDIDEQLRIKRELERIQNNDGTFGDGDARKRSLGRGDGGADEYDEDLNAPGIESLKREYERAKQNDDLDVALDLKNRIAAIEGGGVGFSDGTKAHSGKYNKVKARQRPQGATSKLASIRADVADLEARGGDPNLILQLRSEAARLEEIKREKKIQPLKDQYAEARVRGDIDEALQLMALIQRAEEEYA